MCVCVSFVVLIFSVIFCEAVAIYGVVVAILLATKTETVVALDNGDFPAAAKTAGYAIFAAGGTVGFANLVCGCVSSVALWNIPLAPEGCRVNLEQRFSRGFNRGVPTEC